MEKRCSIGRKTGQPEEWSLSVRFEALRHNSRMVGYPEVIQKATIWISTDKSAYRK
jgi:hypothetical protein